MESATIEPVQQIGSLVEEMLQPKGGLVRIQIGSHKDRLTAQGHLYTLVKVGDDGEFFLCHVSYGGNFVDEYHTADPATVRFEGGVVKVSDLNEVMGRVANLINLWGGEISPWSQIEPIVLVRSEGEGFVQNHKVLDKPSSSMGNFINNFLIALSNKIGEAYVGMHEVGLLPDLYIKLDAILSEVLYTKATWSS